MKKFAVNEMYVKQFWLSHDYIKTKTVPITFECITLPLPDTLTPRNRRTNWCNQRMHANTHASHCDQLPPILLSRLGSGRWHPPFIACLHDTCGETLFVDEIFVSEIYTPKITFQQASRFNAWCAKPVLGYICCFPIHRGTLFVPEIFVCEIRELETFFGPRNTSPTTCEQRLLKRIS